MMTLISQLNNVLYYPILIVVLIAAGLYFSFRTNFVQIRLFGESLKVVTQKPEEDNAISSFQALMVSTASRVGTGNIVGISNAICLGGYGAVFWMWVITIIGSASAFIESTLAQIYKRKDENGDSYGGPAYYIETALKSRGLAVIFAICLILTYAVGFNMLASYNLQSAFKAYDFYDASITPWIIGAVVATLVGFCIMGGGKKVVKVTSTLVPLMGILYIFVSLVVIFNHYQLIPAVFAQIFEEAFDFQAIFGGIAGSALMYGIKRGLYSNEAGVGSAPNAAATANVSHPVKQGLVQMLSVFIDTILICTTTALLCLCSGITPSAEIEGVPYVQMALSTVFGNFGVIFLTISMSLFAFTTLLGNLFYVDNCLTFINKKAPSKTFMTAFRIFAAALVFIGAGMDAGSLWTIAEVMMAVMCLINIPACLILCNTAVKATKDYEKQKRNGDDPVFYAENIGLDTKELAYWK